MYRFGHQALLQQRHDTKNIKKHSFLVVKFGCGPLPVTVENEGLGWDPLLKM